jgi:hypothetical protein
MGQSGPGQSTLLFNQAGQAFSIPLHAAHLQQLPQATTAMYSSDGAQYFQPVTQLTAQQKTTRTDRLEVCVQFIHNHFSFLLPLFSTVLREFLVSEVYKCLSISQTRQTRTYICIYICI